MKTLLLFAATLSIFNCSYGQENKTPLNFFTYQQAQVSEIIRCIYEDKKQRLWFGTNNDGVCMYDGKSLTYFNYSNGFAGRAVREIAEDRNGNLWFATDRGLIKYNGKEFSIFTQKDGLPHSDCWSLLIDRKGIIWIGTLEGACRYEGKNFTAFEVPAAIERDFTRGVTSAKIIWDIKEDSKGRIWLATNGRGVYVYNGRSLANVSKADGLGGNFVNGILEDRKGNIWFATQHNGVSRRTGKSFTHFTDKELCGKEAWRLFEGRKGNIWVSLRGCVARYDGKAFRIFNAKDGLNNCCVQAIFEDNAGRMWFGSGAGLFRLEGERFVNVTKNGRWK